MIKPELARPSQPRRSMKTLSTCLLMALLPAKKNFIYGRCSRDEVMLEWNGRLEMRPSQKRWYANKCGPGCNVKASTGNMTVFNGLNRGY